MLRQKFSYLAGLLLLIAVSSCSKKGNEQGKIIPEDAAMALQFDLNALSKKISWSDIQATSFFKDSITMEEKSDSFLIQILRDPSLSGINLKKDIVAFMQKSADYGQHWVITAYIDDIAKFEKMVNHEKKLEMIKTGDGRQYGIMDEDGSAIAYEKDRFLIISPELKKRRFRSYEDEEDKEKKKEPKGLGAYVDYLFSLKEKKSLAGEERFSQLMKDPGEVRFWYNTNAFQSDDPMAQLVAGFGSMDEFTKDSYFTCALNFADGSIDLLSRTFQSSKMVSMMKKYNNGNLDKNTLSKLPVEDAAMAMAFKFDTRYIPAVIKMIGGDLITGMLRMQTGIDINDAAKAFDGNFMLAMGGLASADSLARLQKMIHDKLENGTDNGLDVAEAMRIKPGSVFLSAGIADKAAFEKLKTIIDRLSGQERRSRGSDEGEMPESSNSDRPITAVTDKSFVLSSSQSLIDQYKANKEINHPFINEFSKYPIGMYMNLSKIIPYGFFENRMLQYNENESRAEEKAMMEAAAFFKNAWLMGGDFEGKAMMLRGKIELSDSKTNAAKQMLAFVEKMYNWQMKKAVTVTPAAAN